MIVKTLLLLALAGLILGDDESGDVKEEHDHGNYYFEYGVSDPHTHDEKTQWEHRDGEHVTGEYTMVEPDGSLRIVKYKAGPHTGFEAHVEHVKKE